jgi:hypothetical protein
VLVPPSTPLVRGSVQKLVELGYLSSAQRKRDAVKHGSFSCRYEDLCVDVPCDKDVCIILEYNKRVRAITNTHNCHVTNKFRLH